MPIETGHVTLTRFNHQRSGLLSDQMALEIWNKSLYFWSRKALQNCVSTLIPISFYQVIFALKVLTDHPCGLNSFLVFSGCIICPSTKVSSDNAAEILNLHSVDPFLWFSAPVKNMFEKSEAKCWYGTEGFSAKLGHQAKLLLDWLEKRLWIDPHFYGWGHIARFKKSSLNVH